MADTLFMVVFLCGMTQAAAPPSADLSRPFAVNVFPSSSAGDWEKLRKTDAWDEDGDDLTILLSEVTGGHVAFTVHYGFDEVLRGRFSRSGGPDLNVFDYGTDGIRNVSSEAARCKLGKRSVVCTKMIFDRIGTFLEKDGGSRVEKSSRTTVWLASEVKGAGVVAVELQIGSDEPVRRQLVAHGSRGKVNWAAPGVVIAAP